MRRRALERPRRHRHHVDLVHQPRARHQLLIDVGGGQQSELQPHDPSFIGRNDTVMMRRLRGWLTANRTTSATSSALIIPSTESGVRPEPIAKSVAIPPGATFITRTPCSRSSWSSDRMKPICPNLDAL